MDTYTEEIHGGEFDWFARDMDGALAMFSTAGEGMVPRSTVKCWEQHTRIFQDTDNPNWGCSGVWEFYGNLGLYVFDWDLPGGPYTKRAVPKVPIAQELESRIVSISNLFEADLKFCDMSSIDFVNLSNEFMVG